MLVPKIRLEFAGNLRKLRKSRHLSQEQMAELIGMDTRYYQRLESNSPGAIKIDTIDKIAKALKIRPAKLFNF